MIVHSFAWVLVQVPRADSNPYCSTAGNFDTLLDPKTPPPCTCARDIAGQSSASGQ